MDFRADPRFESYNSSGYRYNAETETLYLKMRHKQEYEDIVIYYGKPQIEPELENPDGDLSSLDGADRDASVGKDISTNTPEQ